MQLFYNATNTFTCNRYIYSEVSDAEIQTEIDNSTIYKKNYNKMKNKICNTPKKHTQMWRLQQKTNIFLGFHLSVMMSNL